MTTKNVLGHRVSPYTISITFEDGTPVIIGTDNPNFAKIAEQLKVKNYTNLWSLCNPAAGIKAYFNGQIQIKGGSIYANGQPVDHAIVPTILEMIRRNENAEPLLKFLLLLQGNPSMHSRNQLWDFIRKNDIVIYEGGPVSVRGPSGRVTTFDATGYLVLYKGVNNNYTDCHTGTFINKPGLQLVMPRPKVDDDQSRACSAGFHAGAFPYVQSFGARKLLVLVNPADIVSVPHDCSCQKIRCCQYTVLKEVEASTFSKIDGITFKDDGRIPYSVTFLNWKKVANTVVVRAIDVDAASELVRDEYDVKSIVSITPVA